MKNLSWFQFQTGSIRSGYNGTSYVAQVPCFNSKLVRLEVLSTVIHFNIALISFNSKLVRLEGSSAVSVVLTIVTFQFQTGSIRRHLAYAGACTKNSFQFQTGSIRSHILGYSVDGFRFNSKLVRLEDEIRRLVSNGRQIGFNSKLVRLEV